MTCARAATSGNPRLLQVMEGVEHHDEPIAIVRGEIFGALAWNRMFVSPRRAAFRVARLIACAL